MNTTPRLRFPASAAFTLCLITCPPVSEPPPLSAGPAGTGRSHVLLQHDGDKGLWIATWQLVEPTSVLRFERPAAGFRNRVFEVLTPGFRMDLEGEFEVLRTDGPPAREIRVRFPAYDQRLSREYDFFRTFSDGSVAIFTGHLVVQSEGDAGASGPPPFIRTFRIEPPDGAGVVAYGERNEGPLELTTGPRGTYVYVGSAEPVASPDVLAILDPGLPDWVVERTEEFLPRLFSYYGHRLGAEPATRPMVLFDYRRGEDAGVSSGGATLPGLIQLGIEGTGWDRPSTPALVQLLHFLAHEGAHVWNGEIAHYPGGPDAWMHEGSAEAMADRALLVLGVIDHDAFLARQTDALNACRTDLTATSVRTSIKDGRPRTVYTCGNMLALLSEAALRGTGADLFDLWRVVIDSATQQDGAYRFAEYMDAWRTLGANSQDSATLEALVDASFEPDAMARALTRRGVRIREAEPPTGYGSEFGRQAMAHLMVEDCAGFVGFRPTGEGFLLDSNLPCVSLVPGALVVEVAEHRVASQGLGIYDSTHEACALGIEIPVLLEPADSAPQKVTIRCDAPLPPRPAYLRIDGIGPEEPT